MSTILHELIMASAEQAPAAEALRYRGTSINYAALADRVARVSGGLIAAGIRPGDRVAVYLPKQPEAVIAMFAASMAGAVFVPINPRLKPAQVRHILADCRARALVTTADRAHQLAPALQSDISVDLLVSCEGDNPPDAISRMTLPWEVLLAEQPKGARRIDADLAALLYTSGSTGRPKGVMLSHRNLLAGADSVSSYLKNNSDDRLLTVLPFSFDYGFSQLTTAFLCGATAVLFDYLLARDVIRTVEREKITGLACVPPIWIQLARMDWPEPASNALRYITNTGGVLPQPTITALRQRLPTTDIFLMYGLTEAFRSTYLDPTEIDNRPDSIGKAIPNADIQVVRPDGSRCGPDEPGELVHRGALVAMGYWGDAKKTAERFRPVPAHSDGAVLQELAVWSGDTVRVDAEGFMYFIGRKDSMIKTSGYRVSPTEIEEVLYDSGLVTEAIALGIPHPELGQAVVAIAVGIDGNKPTDQLTEFCRERLASYMLPAEIMWHDSLPRNSNGKIDRARLLESTREHFAGMSL